MPNQSQNSGEQASSGQRSAADDAIKKTKDQTLFFPARGSRSLCGWGLLTVVKQSGGKWGFLIWPNIVHKNHPLTHPLSIIWSTQYAETCAWIVIQHQVRSAEETRTTIKFRCLIYSNGSYCWNIFALNLMKKCIFKLCISGSFLAPCNRTPIGWARMD